jgi:hypothetical protein
MHATLTSLLESYGYVVRFLFVALESLSITLPGEPALVTAAAFAAPGLLSIYWVVATAALAAIVGDNGLSSLEQLGLPRQPHCQAADTCRRFSSPSPAPLSPQPPTNPTLST